MKKAQNLASSTLIGFILLAIVVSLMLVKIQQESSPDKYDKKFLAQDTAMFIDTLYSSPNNIVVKYPQKTYDYSFNFKESKVIVSNEKYPAAVELFGFTEDYNTKFIEKELDHNVVVVSAEGKESGGSLPRSIIYLKTKKEVEPFEGLLIENKDE